MFCCGIYALVVTGGDLKVLKAPSDRPDKASWWIWAHPRLRAVNRLLLSGGLPACFVGEALWHSGTWRIVALAVLGVAALVCVLNLWLVRTWRRRGTTTTFVVLPASRPDETYGRTLRRWEQSHQSNRDESGQRGHQRLKPAVARSHLHGRGTIARRSSIGRPEARLVRVRKGP